MNGTQKLLELESPIAQKLDNYIDFQDIKSYLIKTINENQSIHILGQSMSGKSHLARSLYNHIIASGHACVYMDGDTTHPDEILQKDSWLLIDDIDYFRHPEWLISLSQHNPEVKWITTAKTEHPLPDLQSRLKQASNFSLKLVTTDTELRAIIKSIAQRHQYNLSDTFINQCLNFLPWQAPTCIKKIMQLMKYCHHNKVRPTIVNLKTIYENDSP